MIKDIGTPYKCNSNNRVAYWDMAKGFTIILVILGHQMIPHVLRVIIFSFHMPLFFLTNGYFVKDYDIKRTMKRSIISLIIPYIVVCMISAIFYVAQTYSEIDIAIATLKKTKAMVLGISYASSLFTDVDSVGMVWFLPCLFLCRNIYVALCKIISTTFLNSQKMIWGGG